MATSYEVPYGYTRVLRGTTVEAAIERATAALKGEGFGVLTTIDVKATLKQKIGADFRKYVILGACNPNLAHKALGAELGVGLVLPCNVTVFEGDGGDAVVQIIKPQAMFDVIRKKGMEALVQEADQRLRRALEKV